MGISRLEGPVPIAGLGPATLDMHGRQPWQLVPPSWTNVQPGPSMVKFRTAYEAERSGFDAGFHRMQSRDKEQVGIWAARRVEEHLHKYVSWLAEGLSHTRAAADQALDAPHLQSNRLEGPDDIAQADRPQWGRDHPARLGFNNALLRSRDGHVGPYRVVAYPDLLGIPAPGAENGRRYRRRDAGRRPPPLGSRIGMTGWMREWAAPETSPCATWPLPSLECGLYHTISYPYSTMKLPSHRGRRTCSSHAPARPWNFSRT